MPDEKACEGMSHDRFEPAHEDARVRAILEADLREQAEELGALDAQITRLRADKKALTDLADQLATRCERAEQTLAWMQRSTKVRFGMFVSEVLSHPLRIMKLPSALNGMYRDWRRYRTEGPPLVSMHQDLKALLDRLNDLRETALSGSDEGGEQSRAVRVSLGAAIPLADEVLLKPELSAGDGLPLSAGGQLLELSTELDVQEWLVQFDVADAGSRLVMDACFLEKKENGLSGVLSDVHGLAVRRTDEATLRVRLLPPEGTTRIHVRIHSSRGGRVVNACQAQSLRAGVSIVIPTFRGADTLVSTLESIADQDLEWDKFEVIVVQNGPADGTSEKVEAFCASHPGLNLHFVAISGVGAGRARNAGVALANRQYLAFVDDDDWISPSYLASLLAQAAPDIIAISQIVDVEDGIERESHINHQIRQATRIESPSAHDLNKVLCMSAAKLLPTALARQVRFDEGLRSGEDVQYVSALLARFPLSFRLAPLARDAWYRRRVRPHTVSRQPESFDFCVRQRLKVIASIAKELSTCCTIRIRMYLEGVMRSQANFAVRYLREHPEDYARFNTEVIQQELDELECVRWVNAQLADTVIFSYCFAPYIDTAGVVAAKRIREDGVPGDIISNRMDTVRKKDSRLIRLISDLAGEHVILDTPTAFSNWNAIQAFAERGVEAAEQLVARRGRNYTRIYSRAMWPGSHFAAAAYKARHPEASWVAEFSDPLWMDIQGHPRTEPINEAWLHELGIEKLASRQGIKLAHNKGMFFWCEYLPYLMADELVFTNPNQLSYMLSYLVDKRLEVSIRARAVIKPHPTLPARYYGLSDARAELDDTLFNMAYFGSFYANRGLHDVLMAMGELKRSRGGSLPVRLHVYTSQGEALREDDAFDEVSENVVVRGLAGYLDFLALSVQFDCLIVTDTATAGTKAVNPYLPSKVSDYLGSGTQVWAVVEKGSPLSSLGTAQGRIRCMSLGDVRKIRDEMAAGVSTKLGAAA